MRPHLLMCMTPEVQNNCLTSRTEERTCILTQVISVSGGNREEYGMNPIISDKGCRNRPLTERPKAENRRKSKTCCLVKHVFGLEEQSMHGLIVRTIVIVRAKANVAMTNLIYNIFRYTQIVRFQPGSVPTQ